MNLLHSPEHAGYPAEYLIARIRGRSVSLVKEWDSLLLSAGPPESLLPGPYRELLAEHAQEGVWIRMLREYRWVYLQMNRAMRKVFYPFFLFSEMKTLVLCLRTAVQQESGRDREALLSCSLLSKDVKELLLSDADLPFLLEKLEERFLSPEDGAGKLKESYLDQGLKGAEETLSALIFAQIMGLRLHPLLKEFFVYLIDIRNIMSLCKHVRWAVQAAPLFIQGGSISESAMGKASKSVDMQGIARLVHDLTGAPVPEAGAAEIEQALNAGLTKTLRSKARERHDIGLILDYLWKIRSEARNLSILLYSGDMDRQGLRKELVL